MTDFAKQGEETRERIVAFIRSFVEEHRYPPSVREICEATDLTISTVHHQLNVLKRLGVLTSVQRSPRTLVLRDES